VRILPAFLASLLFLAGVFEAVAAANLPSPRGLVNDFAEVLSPAEEGELIAILESFPTSVGAHLVIATLPSLADFGFGAVEEAGIKIAESWRIGEESKDNGILFLLAVADRKLRLEVGRGLEGELPDLLAKRILDEVAQPILREGDFAGATAAVARAVEETLTGREFTPAQKKKLGVDPIVLIYFGVALIGWLGAILGRSKRWWPGGVLGGGVGAGTGFLLGNSFDGIFGIALGAAALGLLFDWSVSREFARRRNAGIPLPWWIGGRGRGGGSSFGSFGGGSFSGGGASGGW